MSEDALLTILMFMVTIIIFVITYLAPLTGIIVAAVLLKKKPKNNPIALTILIISTITFASILVWKIIDIIKFQ